ncbi:MAG: hypothetical protein H0X31_14650 [Nostocaceae cyanobacterium]|nr:hypothetical protein [Nostocaceae cyanobacterium]
MKVQKQEITVEELLRRYAAEQRDFTNVSVRDSREGLLRGIDHLEGANLFDNKKFP